MAHNRERMFWEEPTVKLTFLKDGQVGGFNTRFANPIGVSEATETLHVANEFIMTNKGENKILEMLDAVVKHYQRPGWIVFVTIRGKDLLDSVHQTDNIYHGVYSVTGYDGVTKDFVHHTPKESTLIFG